MGAFIHSGSSYIKVWSTGDVARLTARTSLLFLPCPGTTALLALWISAEAMNITITGTLSLLGVSVHISCRRVLSTHGSNSHTHTHTHTVKHSRTCTHQCMHTRTWTHTTYMRTYIHADTQAYRHLSIVHTYIMNTYIFN